MAPSPRSIVLWVILGTRAMLLLAGALAVTLVGTVPPPVSEALWRVSPHELSNMFARWDTFFYYTIATSGYSWNPAVFTYQDVVFFPLYPMLMRWGGVLLGGHPMIAGLVVSLVAFAAGLLLLYRLALLELGEDYAWRVVLLFAVFPYAMFFSTVYTESLFLFLTVAAFYAMRRQHVGWAAICGLLAGLTRPNGFWLALPLACLAIWPAGGPSMSRDAEADADGAAGARRSRWLALAAACTPIVGVVIFSAYLQIRFADPLAWVHGQDAWGLPLLGRMEAPDPVKLVSSLAVRAIEWVVYAGNIVVFLVAAASILPISRRVGVAYGLWIAVNIFPPVPEHLFLSMGRFVSVLFPVFFWLAYRIPRPRLWQVAAAFAATQAIFAVWFFLWRAVI